MAVRKTTKRKTGPAQKEESQEKKLTLDDVVIALQKTFSRVSARSASVPVENARALVTGQVNFTLSLKVDPQGDYLHPASNGSVDLNLAGVIDTDIRSEEETGSKRPG